MSGEMAVGDNATSEESKVNSDDTATENVETPFEPSPEPLAASPTKETERPVTIKEEPVTEYVEKLEEKPAKVKMEQIKKEVDEIAEANAIEEKRSNKRRASDAFSDNNEDFKGFDKIKHEDLCEDYSRVLERLEAEVLTAIKELKPVRSLKVAIGGPQRASKRPRQDTDGSRPSSALSSRSDGEWPECTPPVTVGNILRAGSSGSTGSAGVRGRRSTTEMSSPLLRVPLERGWRRELVYRAAHDTYSRRNADIYYYTPHGKKLRSTREVAEHLSGTGLTVENFSFFKEPLGVDDPEKEIIRDAKLMRKAESPVPAQPPPTEGKRTPKPKAPKGASPEPATPKSPPSKLKQVKSVGSRLSNNGTPPAASVPKQPRRPQPASGTAPASASASAATANAPASVDNNNTAWKKPRAAGSTQPLPPAHPPPPPLPLPAVATPPPPPPSQPPPPLQSRPLQPQRADTEPKPSPRQLVQPCSMSCGRGAVPSLACAACLCLYHPACAGVSHYQPHQMQNFLCKNCKKSTSPPLEPPPLTHKSGSTASGTTVTSTTPGGASTRRSQAIPSPVPVPAKVRPDKRVLLRMKVAGGGADGSRVWAVAGSGGGGSGTPPPSVRPTLPQSLAVLNGRREKGRGRVANGAASPTGSVVAAVPAVAASPRRRGRPRLDETTSIDYFTPFCARAHQSNYNVAVQIFQYLGMRDLAHSARVCKLWQQLASTPALWRHVRMKNSHVSDWGGLCAALKRHGTKWLDLRKMLLPQNDTIFWDQFAEHIGTIDTLERLELCRCPARAVEAAMARVPGLRALAAPAIRDARLDPASLAALPRLELLRLKSLAGLALASDLSPLAHLTRLQHLSLTSIKELGWCACEVVGQLEQLESLELGECSFGAAFAGALARLSRLRRLRLERGVAHCAAPALLRALATLPRLTRLELVNFDVKVGFDDALAECKNIQRLLIIPTYVSQSATTNKQVLSGVLRLKDTLTHLMWGVTIELLRVTELFIDQCEQGGDKRRDVGECIPVLKPVPGCRLPDERHMVAGPPQVEILPLPTLQRLLSAQLPNTKLKLLRIPFHATWRQSLADFQ